jgi:hypothetical protein
VVPNPGDPQSLNRYSYVSNRPLTLNDPTGHQGHDPYQVQHDMEDAESEGLTEPSASTSTSDEELGSRAGSQAAGIQFPYQPFPPPDLPPGDYTPTTPGGPIPGQWGPSNTWPSKTVYHTDDGFEMRPDQGGGSDRYGEQPHWHWYSPEDDDEGTWPPRDGPNGYGYGDRGKGQRAQRGTYDPNIPGYAAVALLVAGGIYAGSQIYASANAGSAYSLAGAAAVGEAWCRLR